MLALLFYLVVPAAGVMLLRIAYRVHVLRDYRYIKGADFRPAANPERVARPFAIMTGSAGVAVLLLAIAIPVFRIPLQAWAGFIVLLTIPMVIFRAWMLRQLKKRPS